VTPLTLQVLRRLTTYALVAVALLWAVPPVLRHFGQIGPSIEQQIAGAQRALEAARIYGADERLASFRAAEGALERARREHSRGHRRAAHVAAEEARAHAVDAQRLTLAERDELRRRATAVVEQIDRELNALEALYDQAARDADKAGVAPLLSLMKTARQTGARLFVAYEQGDHRRVVAEADATLRALAQARAKLAAAARH
jgi:hypothetical protein